MNDRDMLLTALEILGGHDPEVSITAEHDQIWLHLPGVFYEEGEDVGTDEDGECVVLRPSPLSPDECARMQEKGWFVDAEVGSLVSLRLMNRFVFAGERLSPKAARTGTT